MIDNSLKYTCLFGGGAIRGAAYAGVVRALEELNIHPQNIAGSSVGAVVAALLAIGCDANELKKVFLEVKFDLFRDFQFTLGPTLALSKGELFLEWMRELIEKKYYGSKYQKGMNKAVTFKDIDKNLIIITTDLSNFECKEFSKFETPDFEIATAVRISCSMPGLMKPVEYNNTKLVDGDLQKSMPMWKLSNHLPIEEERVLEFRLEGDYEGSDRNALDYMNTIYSCITSMGTSFITETYGNKDKFDYIVINTGNVIVVDFNYPKEKREELIESGYNQTMNYFTRVLPHKKENLLDNYYFLNKQLKRINKLFTRHKIMKTKSEIAELFIHLCEMKDYIDENIYIKIRDFQKSFYKNIKYPALFGHVKVKNSEDLNQKLDELIEMTTTKIYELEKYIINHPI